MGHVKCVYPFGVRLGVQLDFAGTPSQLHFDYVRDQVVNLLDSHQVWRVVALSLLPFLKCSSSLEVSL